MKRNLLLAATALTLVPAHALAQTAPAPAREPAAPAAAPAADDEEGEEIVVTGQRERGAVVGDIKPELQLNAADVRALGVSSIQDLLTELGPQLQSGRGGTPVVLLEGRRIASFREIATIPTEAIQRVDILPEEVALKYGYSADQKVMNIVLRQRFRALTFEVGDRIVTDGGGNRTEVEGDLLRIYRGGRFNIHSEVRTTNPITEAQRGIGLADGSGPYRTLLADQQTFTTKALWAKNLPDNVQLTISGQLDTSDSTRTFGLQGATLTVPANSAYNATGTPVTFSRTFDSQSPLATNSSTRSGSAGLTLSGSFDNKWQWTFTGTYDHDEAETLTGRGFDTTAFANAVAAGRPALIRAASFR
jgi:iron complex outermembrane recepter protein